MKITAFCCYNSLYGDGNPNHAAKSVLPGVHKVELACSSRLEPIHIMKELENGADGVIVLACPPEACGMIHGSARIGKRIEYVKKLIAEAGIEPERVMLYRPAPPSADSFGDTVAEAAAGFEKLGPSPLK